MAGWSAVITIHVSFCRTCGWRSEGTAHEALAAGQKHLDNGGPVEHDVAYLARQQDDA